MKMLRNKDNLRIAFVDPCSAAGYDLPDLQAGGLGGTEATVLRVATALGPGCDIAHHQNGRTRMQWSAAGWLSGLDDMERADDPHVIVVINRWKVAVKLRKRYPDLPIFLWLHVYPGRHNRKMGAALKSTGVTVICVSNTHADELRTFLGPDDVPELRVIYNPLDDGLRPDDTPRDPDRLLFASSPHKGLREVFDQFSTLREDIPNLTLAVADPGYLQWDTGPVPDGVIFLGSVSHPALVRHMRRALCLFYPQTSFAETFGLVLAEANAVGTPTLVHAGLGANDEIIADADQLVNGNDAVQILARIQEWQRTPLHTAANPDFRLRKVAQEWTQVLHRAAAARSRLSVVTS